MKLYGLPLSPTPRRARIFATEKGIDVELVTVNVREREQFDEALRAVSQDCTVSLLELDDDPATERRMGQAEFSPSAALPAGRSRGSTIQAARNL